MVQIFKVINDNIIWQASQEKWRVSALHVRERNVAHHCWLTRKWTYEGDKAKDVQIYGRIYNLDDLLESNELQVEELEIALEQLAEKYKQLKDCDVQVLELIQEEECIRHRIRCSLRTLRILWYRFYILNSLKLN